MLPGAFPLIQSLPVCGNSLDELHTAGERNLNFWGGTYGSSAYLKRKKIILQATIQIVGLM